MSIKEDLHRLVDLVPEEREAAAAERPLHPVARQLRALLDASSGTPQLTDAHASAE